MMRGLRSSLAPLVGQTQPVHHTRPEVLVEHIELGDQPLHHRQSRSGFQSEATSYSSLGRARAIMIATTAKLARISGSVTNGPSPPAGGVPPGCRPRGPLDALAMRTSHLSVVTNAPGDSEVARSGNLRATSLMRRRHLGFPSSRLQR